MKMQAELDRAFLTAAARLGEIVMYSRPEGPTFEALDPFPVTAFVNTSGPFSVPNSALAGQLTVLAGSIPLGPQKRDLFVWKGATWLIQEVGPDDEVGTKALGFRKVNPNA